MNNIFQATLNFLTCVAEGGHTWHSECDVCSKCGAKKNGPSLLDLMRPTEETLKAICHPCWSDMKPRPPPYLYLGPNATETCIRCKQIVVERDVVWVDS